MSAALPLPARAPAPGRRTVLALAATALATGAVLSSAVPATAHVTVSSPDAAPGGYAKVVFRLPNESETATTTRLTVTLPGDAPFASVRTEAVPGWRAVVTRKRLPEPREVGDLRLTEVPSQVTWTATEGSGVPVGQFAELALSVGPLPEDPGELRFSARETYSDGEVVDWDEPTPASGEEPEHPAPVLAVAASGDGGSADAHGSAGDGGAADTDAGDTDDTASSDGGSALAWTGPAGLALGVVAAGLGGLALRRSSRQDRV